MMHRSLALMLALAILGWADVALAEDESRQESSRADDLDVTMRVIEDPDAVSPEAITRRISLPAPRREDGRAVSPSSQDTPAEGPETSEMAREEGRKFGAEIAEQAREMAEQAKEQREEFDRSRAEEMRPDPPGRPDTDPPVPPRPDGR